MENHINTKPFRIVFAADAGFFDYLFVAIQTLIDFSDSNKNYVISILAKNFTPKEENLFAKLNKEHIKIELCAVEDYLKKMDITDLNVNLHWSSATYYRILIPFLFENDNKVLYLDSDIAVQDDVSKIFETDLKENEIGAILDFDAKTYRQKRISYIQNTLKIEDYKKYFNAGVILFNIGKINKDAYLKEFLELSKRKFEFLDQDILNIMFQNKVEFLPFEWNFQYHVLFKGQKGEAVLQNKTYENITPKIIHYTTNKKPWNSPDFEFSDCWWISARKTPVYEKILYAETLFKPLSALSRLIRFAYNVNKFLLLCPCKKIKAKARKKINILKIYRERLKKNY